MDPAGRGRIIHHGNGMSPLLQDGDELVVAPARWEDIRPGDLVTYRLRDLYPTFRVIRTRGEMMQLIGDNWPWSSFRAWREDLIGKVIARRRGGQTLDEDSWRWRAQTLRMLMRHRKWNPVSRFRRRLGARAAEVRERWLCRRHGYDGLPVCLQINVSAACNLQCVMCPYLGVHKSREYGRFMTPATFERLLPVLGLLKRVHFSGAGEPLYSPHLLDFMRQARSRHPNLPIELTTNGSRLDEATARALIAVPVSKIHVSFDGADPETVAAIRRRVKPLEVIDNIARLHRLKSETGSRYPVIMVNYMTGRGTCSEIEEFIEVARRTGIQEIQLLEMQPRNREDFAGSLFHHIGRDRGRALREAVKLADRYGIRLHLPVTAHNSCHFPSIPHVSEDGEVYPCCFLDYDGRALYSNGKTVRMPSVSFGNVNRTGFREIWNSTAFEEFRRRNREGRFSDPCRSCMDARVPTSRRVLDTIELP